MALNPFLWEIYCEFVENRHLVWESRQSGVPGPWTDDPILQNYKFTNVFRILDTGSQYLLGLLKDTEPEDRLWLAFLYRYLNRPEPFEWWRQNSGGGPSPRSSDAFCQALVHEYRGPVFGAAYRMFSGGENPGINRTEWAFGLADQAHRLEMPAALGREWAMQLETLPRVGPFMSMQILTDLGYLDGDWDENAWVQPGPGARAGAALLGFRNALDAIDLARLELEHVQLKGHSPSLMDLQNTLCEFSKYHRYMAGRRGRSYTPGLKPPPPPVLPPTW